MIKDMIQRKHNRKFSKEFIVEGTYISDKNTKVMTILKHTTLDLEYIKQIITLPKEKYSLDYFILDKTSKESLSKVIQHFAKQAYASQIIDFKKIHTDFLDNPSNVISNKNLNLYCKKEPILRNKQYELIIEQCNKEPNLYKLGVKITYLNHKNPISDNKVDCFNSIIFAASSLGLGVPINYIKNKLENITDENEIVISYKFPDLNLYQDFKLSNKENLEISFSYPSSKRGLIDIVLNLLNYFECDVNWAQLYDNFLIDKTIQTKMLFDTNIYVVLENYVAIQKCNILCSIYEEDDFFKFNISIEPIHNTNWKYN